MGYGEMCILVLSAAKGRCFFCGAVSEGAARDPAESLLGALPEERFELCAVVISLLLRIS